MDNRIANDMISSGMIPSGEKKKEDLGRTQYGSAPSPSKLMDAYKSMYDKKEEVINEHHKKDADGNTIPHEHEEELNEGKIPAGLQAYLDKKKGKKEDKKEMKEGAGLYANIHAKRKRGGKMRKKGDAGAPSSQDFANAAKTAKEEVDKFDVVFNHFINEGHTEKEAYSKMANLTEEQLDEFMKMLAAKAAQYGANLGQKTKIDAVGGIKRKPFEPQRKPFDAKPKPGEQGFKAKSASEVISSVHSSRRKPEKEVKEGIGAAVKMAFNAVKNIAKKETVKKLAGDAARGAAMQAGGSMVGGMMSGGGQQKPKTGTVSATQYASADLFDIVKGQLLDEGLSEEEIRDIMLTLTPDEIMKEMNQGPSTPVKNYGDSPDKPKILPNFGATRAKVKTTEKGTVIKGGKDTGATPTERQSMFDAISGKRVPDLKKEEYKNFDPKNPDLKQMKAQAQQEKNRQKFNDPMGVKNKNIGGQGLDPMDK